MKEITQSHQAFFFCNNENTAPTPPNIGALMAALGKFELIPTIGNEFQAQTGAKRQFIVMVNSDETVRLEMPSSGISLVKQGGTRESFYELMKNVFNALQSVFPEKKANRLSLLNTAFFQGSNEEYEALYQKLFTYKDVKPFEWDNRIVEKRELANSREKINSISIVRRCENRIPDFNNGNLTDLVLFDIDSNTDAYDNSFRFTFDAALSVWEELYANNERLTEQLQRYEK
ncbi:hypothetical protein RRJ81_002640 [Vibrio parahaemolyticus]|nr:hypothetical protein [Vibrio parahaemolyticus]HCE3461883.1 hypothetical protein [Vibrio parahaemolyticus]